MTNYATKNFLPLKWKNISSQLVQNTKCQTWIGWCNPYNAGCIIQVAGHVLWPRAAGCITHKKAHISVSGGLQIVGMKELLFLWKEHATGLANQYHRFNRLVASD